MSRKMCRGRGHARKEGLREPRGRRVTTAGLPATRRRSLCSGPGRRMDPASWGNAKPDVSRPTIHAGAGGRLHADDRRNQPEQAVVPPGGEVPAGGEISRQRRRCAGTLLRQKPESVRLVLDPSMESPGKHAPGLPGSVEGHRLEALPGAPSYLYGTVIPKNAFRPPTSSGNRRPVVVRLDNGKRRVHLREPTRTRWRHAHLPGERRARFTTAERHRSGPPPQPGVTRMASDAGFFDRRACFE